MHVNLNWAEFLSSIEYPVKCKQNQSVKIRGVGEGGQGDGTPPLLCSSLLECLRKPQECTSEDLKSQIFPGSCPCPHPLRRDYD